MVEIIFFFFFYTLTIVNTYQTAKYSVLHCVDLDARVYGHAARCDSRPRVLTVEIKNRKLALEEETSEHNTAVGNRTVRSRRTVYYIL